MFVSAGGAGGTSGADPGSFIDPSRIHCGGTLIPCSGRSFAGGPGQIIYGRYGGPSPEDIIYGIVPPSLDGTCTTSSHPVPSLCNAVGSTWECPPGPAITMAATISSSRRFPNVSAKLTLKIPAPSSAFPWGSCPMY